MQIAHINKQESRTAFVARAQQRFNFAPPEYVELINDVESLFKSIGAMNTKTDAIAEKNNVDKKLLIDTGWELELAATYGKRFFKLHVKIYSAKDTIEEMQFIEITKQQHATLKKELKKDRLRNKG